ncbi:hypothetical protein [Dyadobacter pollutisoli]|jgi:hypothetical protein|uniref:DUF5004 domain-containing protein n=1 Tax=Dyadobacter pollutisoli TaxID=2910158 RepID=A0A9E8NE40_9BACT|nr:hypothetical protein [Dyadobacter pollutisoli]WAC12627.1 hypothetical protein ON006_01420 [Dyadobacter pollutisoli]
MKTFKFTLLILPVIIFLSSCSKDSLAPVEELPSLAGTFTVAETSTFPDGRTDRDEYVITINKSATDKSYFEIANFAGLLKKKVQVLVDGEKFNIPSQTFQAGNSKMTVAGSGTLQGSRLTFAYTVRGDFTWDANCVSDKR